MCTIGAVSNINERGERLGFLMKTIDGSQTETFHGVCRAVNGSQIVFSSMMRQSGTNIGMNQNGLAATISYSDCWQPGNLNKDEIPKLENDTRALSNAEVLANCKSVEEGIEAIKTFVIHHPDQAGGNHLLIDAKGTIAILEQYKGRYEYRMFSDKGYCGRANNSHWLIKDKQSNLLIPQDSIPRQDAMEKFLKHVHENIPLGMSNHQIINDAKSFFSRHTGREDQIASICVHGLISPGTRLYGNEPCHTQTAVIIDMKERRMHYSLGYPCSGVWKIQKLE